MTNGKIDVRKILKEFDNLPRFKDGRINYTNSRRAPCLAVFVNFDKKILLLKRSEKVLVYKGMWSCLGGFIDNPNKTIREQVLEEINEELGITERDVLEIKEGKMWEFLDKEINRAWIQFPVLVILKRKPKIKLDWESTRYIWEKPEDIYKINNLVYNVDENLRRVLHK